jgi:hypothetical protein
MGFLNRANTDPVMQVLVAHVASNSRQNRLHDFSLDIREPEVAGLNLSIKLFTRFN